MRIARLSLLVALLAAPSASAAESIQPGDKIAQGCTLAWVFDAPDGRVFFATASHCFQAVGERVHLAEATPDNEAIPTEPLGVVRARGDHEAIEADVAFVEVDPALHGRVAPEMRGHPTIPSGVLPTNEAAPGDLLQLSGWGTGFTADATTRERRQGALLLTQPGVWIGATPIMGGDSGGPVAHAATGAAYGLVKGFGCRSSQGEQICGSAGPTIDGVHSVAAAAGLALRMRLAGQPAPAPAAAPAPSEPAAATPPPPAPAGCASTTPLRIEVARLRLRRSGLALSGSVAADRCSPAPARVQVALALRHRTRCRHLVGRSLSRGRACAPRWTAVPLAGGSWSLARRLRLPAGRYVIRIRASGADGSAVTARRSARVR